MLLFNPPQWLRSKQSEALRAAEELGWPHKKDEGWRHTSLRELENIEFSPVSHEESELSVPAKVEELVSDADFKLFFHNGEYIKTPSKTSTQEDVIVSPLSRVLMSAGRLQERAKSFLDRKPNSSLKGIGYKNLANFNQGAYVQIEGASQNRTKVAIIHLYGKQTNVAEENPFIVYPRSIYSIGPNMQVDLVEIHIALNNVEFQTAVATDLHLGIGAKVNMARVSRLGNFAFGFNDTLGVVSKDASLDFFDLVIGGKLTRNDLEAHLAETGAELNLLNLNLATPGSHIDNSTSVVHLKGETTSDQVIRSVLHKESKSVFSGRLKIEQDAQKSTAKQYCHNLLLSDTAEADARPQLEVHADDVKAAHGTTIGQLSEQQLFYLQSRAISKVDAEKMLAAGFEQSILCRIKSSFIKKIVQACRQEPF